jgi:hypothetical protein
MEMRHRYIIAIVAFLFLMTGGAFAFDQDGNPGDTLGGTVISAEGYENTMDYDDIQGNPRDTEYGATLEAEVASVYGWSARKTPSVKFATTTPGSTETWDFVGTNEGNASLTFTVTLGAISYDPSGSNWVASLEYGGQGYGTTLVVTLEEDGEEAVKLQFTPGTTETDSPDGGLADFTFYAITGYAHAGGGSAGEYTGANDLTYGGWGPIAEVYLATIEAPDITISRTVTVDAPTSYNGDPHDLVPGSVLIYTLTYSNEGSGKADNILIADEVPTPECALAVFNVQQPQPYITITATTGSVANWETFYTLSDAPDTDTYDASGWTSAGTIDQVSDEFTTPQYTRWIKWQKSTLAPGEYGTLQWGLLVY